MCCILAHRRCLLFPSEAAYDNVSRQMACRQGRLGNVSASRRDDDRFASTSFDLGQGGRGPWERFEELESRPNECGPELIGRDIEKLLGDPAAEFGPDRWPKAAHELIRIYGGAERCVYGFEGEGGGLTGVDQGQIQVESDPGGGMPGE